MNFGSFFAWSGVALASLASIGYFVAGDIRLCLYYLCCVAITIVVIWK